jgi:hypothetical protein
MGKFDSFLKKIKLIENFNLEIPLSTNDLVEKWQVVLYKDQTGFLGDKYSSKSKFIGEVDLNGFKCEKDRRSMNKDKVVVTAKGNFTSLINKTKIDVEITVIDLSIKIIFSFVILILLILLLFVFTSNFKNNNQNSEYAIPVNLFVFMMLCCFGYYMMRKSMKIMKYDLEKELQNLIKE